MLQLIPNGNIKTSHWFKSFLFFPWWGESKRKKEIRNGERIVTHIQRTKYHGVHWVQIIWLRLNQMHKLSHLNVNICPKHIFFLVIRWRSSLPFSPSFSSLLYDQWEARPSPVGGFPPVLQLLDPEAFSHLDACLCFSVSGGHWDALGGRKGRSPVGEGLAPKAGNMQVLPAPLSGKKGITGVRPKLGREQRWKDWAVTPHFSMPNDAHRWY